MALMRAAGMTAKMSSIHVNGWFGAYDKLAMTRRLLRDEFGIDLDAERERFVFVGDSPNDAPMFEYFPYAVGVANVREVRRTAWRACRRTSPSASRARDSPSWRALLAAR